MVEMIFLGAWLMILLIVGVIISFTGLPETTGNEPDGKILVAVIRFLYLVALSITFYQIGVFFSTI